MGGKLSDLKRVSMPIRWLQMSKFRMNVARCASSAEVAAMVDESDFLAEYNKSALGRRNACIRKREQLNDFGRFKLFFVKGQFKKAVSKELLKLRAAQRNISVAKLVQQKRK